MAHGITPNSSGLRTAVTVEDARVGAQDVHRFLQDLG